MAVVLLVMDSRGALGKHWRNWRREDIGIIGI